MKEIFRFSGMGLILFAALTFYREYKKHLEYREGLCEGFFKLLGHIRRQIDCYLTPASELLSGFCDELLEMCGFLSLAREVGVKDAYFSMERELRLSSSAKEILHSLLNDFGKDYKDGTVKEIDRALASLEKTLLREREENEKEKKITGVVCAAAAVGIIILII